MATIGGVLRDHQGMVLAAFSSFLGHQSILVTELIALLQGLDLASQLGFFFILRWNLIQPLWFHGLFQVHSCGGILLTSLCVFGYWPQGMQIIAYYCHYYYL